MFYTVEITVTKKDKRYESHKKELSGGTMLKQNGRAKQIDLIVIPLNSRFFLFPQELRSMQTHLCATPTDIYFQADSSRYRIMLWKPDSILKFRSVEFL